MIASYTFGLLKLRRTASHNQFFYQMIKLTSIVKIPEKAKLFLVLQDTYKSIIQIVRAIEYGPFKSHVQASEL